MLPCEEQILIVSCKMCSCGLVPLQRPFCQGQVMSP